MKLITIMLLGFFLISCTGYDNNVNSNTVQNTTVNAIDEKSVDSNSLTDSKILLSEYDQSIKDSYDELILNAIQYTDDEFQQKARELIERAKRIENKPQREFILIQLYTHTSFDDASAYVDEILKARPDDWGLLVYRCALQEMQQKTTDEIQACYQELLPIAKTRSENGEFKDAADYYLALYKSGDKNAKQKLIELINTLPESERQIYNAMIAMLE